MIRAFVRYCPNTVSKCVTACYFKIGSFLSNGVGQFHSSPETVRLKNEETKEAAAVDPVEPSKVLNAALEENVILRTVLTTHHHWDHAGGNKQIIKSLPSLEIIGGDDRIDGLTKKVHHNDKLKIGNLTVKCLSTPCHTKGHICYYIPLKNEPPVVFTGDTLFTAGCGRFFEGTASEMYKALIEVLGELPDETQVFSGHEYGVSNLNFAHHVEPRNRYIKERLEWALAQRKQNKPTVPSTIGYEKKTNPFMRVCESDMQSMFRNSDPVFVMGALREKKNGFTG